MIESLNLNGDLVCDICIKIMMCMSAWSGLSYGLVNVLLFIVLGPLSTLLFMASAFIANRRGRNKVSTVLNILGVLVILLVLLPIAYTMWHYPMLPQ